MDWFKDLYDGYMMKKTFGSVSEEKTEKEVDFIYEICRLCKGAKVLDLRYQKKFMEILFCP